MKKNINLIIVTLMIVCMGFTIVNAQTIARGTINTEETNLNTNLYLEFNDAVKVAMDNYNSGSISQDEYIKIMSEIKNKLEVNGVYEQVKSDAVSISNEGISVCANTCTSGGGDYEDYLLFDRFTPEEIWLFTTHPIKSAEAKSLAETASAKTQELYKAYTRWQGNGDAFRHAYWSALMTKHIDRDYAYDAGLAHEGLERGYSFSAQSDDVKMDISNNYAGRILGDDNSSLSDTKLANLIRDEVSAGNLERIRTYTSNSSLMDCKLNGVMTKYVGYYVPTSDGGLN